MSQNDQFIIKVVGVKANYLFILIHQLIVATIAAIGLFFCFLTKESILWLYLEDLLVMFLRINSCQ